MSILRKIPSVIGAFGLTLAAGAALAQSAPAPTSPAAPGQGHWAEHRAEMREHFEHMRAEHLKTLHDALSIQPNQEGAWQAFVAATAPQPHEHKAQGERGEHAHLTTPERLDRMEKRMDERQAAFHRHADAVKALYAALSPTQQKTFDALAKLHGMHGGFGHHGMHGGMGGMGHGGPGMAPAGGE